MNKFTLRDMFRLLTNVCLALGLIMAVQNAPRGEIGKVDVQGVWLLALMFANFFLLFFHVLLIPRWKLECYLYGSVSSLLGILNSSDTGQGHGILGAFVFLPAMLFLILCFHYSRRLKKESAWSDRLAEMVNPFEE